MKAIDLLNFLSNSKNSIGPFAIVKNSFIDYDNYGKWFEGVVFPHFDIHTIKDINGVYQCRGYRKIRKYLDNNRDKCVILYGYVIRYRRSSDNIIYVENKNFPEMSNELHQLIKVETYRTLPNDEGCFFEAGIIVELID